MDVLYHQPRKLMGHVCASRSPWYCHAPALTQAASCVWQDSDDFEEAISSVHAASAKRLQRLCRENGGVYIKAAQLLSTAQSVPVQYRRQGAASCMHASACACMCL